MNFWKDLKLLDFIGKRKWRWGERWNGTKVVVVGDEDDCLISCILEDNCFIFGGLNGTNGYCFVVCVDNID